MKKKKRKIKKETDAQILNLKSGINIILTNEQKKDEYIQDFLSRLENNLQSNLFVEPESSIVVAVSGGVDSVTLLDSLALLSIKLGYKLFIAHFNHKLRPKTSDEDEAFVKNLAKSYNIDFYSLKGDVQKHSRENSMSIEQSARDLRYTFLEHITKTIQAEFLATGHTKDDSAETFLLNLMRGSGLTGLSGIPQKRYISKNSSIIRPLLIFGKDELIEYAKRRGLKWSEDESNTLMNYTRNKIRNSLLIQLKNEFTPNIIDLINRSAKLIRGADKFIKEHINHFLNEALEQKQKNKFSLRIPVLETFDEFIQGEIIQKALTDIFKHPPISLKSIDNLNNLMKKPVGSILEINKKITVLKDREQLIFYFNKAINRVNITINKEGDFDCGSIIISLKKVTKRNVKFNDDPTIEYFDYDILPNVLQVRNIEPNDKFQPLGMTENVNITDFLTNNKIPFLEKQDMLVLSVKSEIVWICGIRINDKYRVTDNTINFLRAEMIKKE